MSSSTKSFLIALGAIIAMVLFCMFTPRATKTPSKPYSSTVMVHCSKMGGMDGSVMLISEPKPTCKHSYTVAEAEFDAAMERVGVRSYVRRNTISGTCYQNGMCRITFEDIPSE